ncbi:10A19I.15 [Zea mays]|uniref:10A19I.15 n=1 Tax=Zea mays TaxID=4577 RepID=A0A1D6PJ27_MAIZE|nr:10A19I.15 [Zea mays]
MTSLGVVAGAGSTPDVTPTAPLTAALAAAFYGAIASAGVAPTFHLLRLITDSHGVNKAERRLVPTSDPQRKADLGPGAGAVVFPPRLRQLVFNSLFTHILVFNSLITSVREMDDVQEIEQRSQPQIFWTQEMSACALKYLAQLVVDGIRVDKGFKSSHYNQCAKVVKERFQVQVSGSQVTNHLKTWRTSWSNICNYKKISSAHFDERTGTILLDEKNYLERVQPLENYHYVVVIFGNHQATGLFAKCTSDPLGFDTSESACIYGVGYSGDLAGHGSNNASPTRDSGESLNPSGPIRDGGDSSTRSGARRKRGCMMMEDEDPLICTVTEAFKTLSDAIKQLAPQPRPIIPPNLWTMMKQIPVFEREHIAHYYGY